jgi:hypothetical protein
MNIPMRSGDVALILALLRRRINIMLIVCGRGSNMDILKEKFMME